MDKQFITDVKGNRIAVILPIDEYIKLTEKSDKIKTEIVSENNETYEKRKIISKEQETELDDRFEYMMNNPMKGKTWEEVKKNISAK